MTSPRTEPRRGFTLVEILVALAVVITIFAPIFALLVMSTKRAYRAGDTTVATIYASDVLEIIRGAPFEAFKPDDRPMSLRQVLYEHNIPTGYEIDKYDQRFNVSATVGPVSKDIPPGDMKRVTIQVTWVERLKTPAQTGATEGGSGTPSNERRVVLTTFYTPTK